MSDIAQRDVTIPPGDARLYGILALPPGARSIVVFAHGSGSSRMSPRNQEVAVALQRMRIGTLLFDLLTEQEAEADDLTRAYRFDIPLLGERLVAATDWLGGQDATQALAVGYFGASTGAGAALVAAAARPAVRAVVSRGGRPDLAGEVLGQVEAPVLLIVGGRDTQVIEMNRGAQARLNGVVELVVVEGATHLFEEPGAMAEVTRHATAWFARYLG
jgi:dienelactone hydrolase